MKKFNKLVFLMLSIGIISMIFGAFYKVNHLAFADELLGFGLLLQSSAIGCLVYLNLPRIKKLFNRRR